ncbi:MAG TPA: pyrroloquinoline quinone-dependent dehydrogenase [Thermoanaerobaculia bacterium]|nr:pyrroloquinoline quinone-dependent dehydrogenase [Thermoanaerobaculia bacterium]
MRLRLIFLAATLVASLAAAQTNVEWPAYANDAAGTHYSPLSGITKANVNKLTVAWTYRTGALTPETGLNKKAAFEATPLMVGGTLYVITPFNKVIALDPATGTERWTYDPKVDRGLNYSEVTSRGVSMWKKSRLFFGTIDGRLICLDAKAGKPCAGFGEGGAIMLNYDSDPPDVGEHEVTSPPAIVGDLVVVGSAIGDNGRVDMGRGLVRAYDVRTGKQRWSFNTLLPLGDNNSSGAANAWSLITVDAARKMLFVPTSSPSPDYFGGLRPGDDNYANSVVALDAMTGNVMWHFQVVHHDLWDYDIASQPVLVMFKSTPAVAVTTKMGHLFILDRRSGKPLLPIEERAVPKSDIPEERASATQPFPRNPSLVPNRLTAADAWGKDDAEREACRAKIAALRNDGIFTPPSVGGTLVYPGNVGGVAWGGAAYDPVRKLLIVPTNRLAFAVRLIPRAEFAAERAKANDNRLRGEFGGQTGAPYAMYREPLMSPNGVPCNPPPWGALSAVDVETGAIKWEVPIGARATPALGGALVTASGLTFISAALWDDTLRAFDTVTGKVVWETKLPAGGQSTPMTYRYKGHQYIVLAAGGHAKAGTTLGDHVLAWRLK